MPNHYKKLIAPFVVTVLLVVYLGAILIQGLVYAEGMQGRALLFIILAALISLSVYVLIERIKEVRSGEEDDLSKY